MNKIASIGLICAATMWGAQAADRDELPSIAGSNQVMKDVPPPATERKTREQRAAEAEERVRKEQQQESERFVAGLSDEVREYLIEHERSEREKKKTEIIEAARKVREMWQRLGLAH